MNYLLEAVNDFSPGVVGRPTTEAAWLRIIQIPLSAVCAPIHPVFGTNQEVIDNIEASRQGVFPPAQTSLRVRWKA